MNSSLKILDDLEEKKPVVEIVGSRYDKMGIARVVAKILFNRKERESDGRKSFCHLRACVEPGTGTE